MTPRRRRQQRRKGFLLHETIMAIVVVTAVIVGACQLLQLVAAQRRTAEYRAIAVLETANVMEDLLSRRWDELTPEATDIELSPLCRERLPAPEMRIDLASENGDANSRRIRVEMDWQNSSGQRGQPIRLVAWRYRSMEVRP
jgi:hypothetical protein